MQNLWSAVPRNLSVGTFIWRIIECSLDMYPAIVTQNPRRQPYGAIWAADEGVGVPFFSSPAFLKTAWAQGHLVTMMVTATPTANNVLVMVKVAGEDADAMSPVADSPPLLPGTASGGRNPSPNSNPPPTRRSFHDAVWWLVGF